MRAAARYVVFALRFVGSFRWQVIGRLAVRCVAGVLSPFVAPTEMFARSWPLARDALDALDPGGPYILPAGFGSTRAWSEVDRSWRRMLET